MNIYVLVKHVCEADLVLGVFSSEAWARVSMQAAKQADPIEGYSIELWKLDGDRVSDGVAWA